MCETVNRNLKISKDPYVFDMDKNDFPALTEENFERINFIIKHDSNYRPLDDKGTDPISKTIKDNIKKNDVIFSNEINDILTVVKKIDKLNSTRQSSLGPKIKGRGGQEATACYISSIVDFYERLGKGDTTLVDDIAKHAISIESIKKAKELAKELKWIEVSNVDLEGINDNDEILRYTFSFASKYCAYMARALFEGEKGEDGYCIFDKVMCDILPYYAWVYLGDSNYIKLSRPKAKRKTDNIDEQLEPVPPKIVSTIKDEFAIKSSGNYRKYSELIDRIIQSAERLYCSEYPGKQCHISRKNFDHLLWYYFKGGNPEIERALELVGDESALLR